jgi:Cu+-exporting ATPase
MLILNVKEDAKMAKDPICGMNVDENKAAGTAVYEGKTYYFCSAGCKAKFENEPDKYAKD